MENLTIGINPSLIPDFWKLNPKKYEWVGIIITLLLIGLGIYVIYKNHKRDGFWIGVLALFLIGSSLSILKPSATE